MLSIQSIQFDSLQAFRDILVICLTESKLCKTTAEQFGISSIFADMDLFSTVLDSLSSIKLAAHLRTAFRLPRISCSNGSDNL